MQKFLSLAFLAFAALGAQARATEQTIISLRDFSGAELKYAGIVVSQSTKLHIRALGGGSDGNWTSKDERMFAYGWILNADTREPVWTMTMGNSWRKNSDREFDGSITLDAGSYEVYFVAYGFAVRTGFSNMSINIDHRRHPLFGDDDHSRNFLSWFKDFWSDDLKKEFSKRSPRWGIDVLVDESSAGGIRQFPPPKDLPNTVARAIGVGDDQCLRIAFEMNEAAKLHVSALGEDGSEGDLVDYAWIVNIADRHRVWEMQRNALSSAGGAQKNRKCEDDIDLPKGKYLLYYVTDDSHSMSDWNAAPPVDPLYYGVNLSFSDPRDKAKFHQFAFQDYQDEIVSLVKPGNNAHLTAGFTLKQDADLRVLAIGERGSGRRSMADCGTIYDARTRVKVWTMDADRTVHAGGASKNRMIDEVIHLPRGSYLVTYTTDDSHAFGDWNSDPPFDPARYGITVMGAGSTFSPSMIEKYVDEHSKNVIAQIVRVGDDADSRESFKLNRPTKIRIYAIGEGQGHEMYDYGWIEDAKTGNSVWEMTYAITFYAGGGRKNRMVNTSVLLDKGEYTLRYKSDDSHCYGDWNVDPPEDQEFWGITLFRDDGTLVAPAVPVEPDQSEDDDVPNKIPAPPAPPQPQHIP